MMAAFFFFFQCLSTAKKQGMHSTSLADSTAVGTSDPNFISQARTITGDTSGKVR